MDMKKNTFQQFCAYYDSMADAERKRDYKKVKKFLKKMEQLPAENELQKWLLKESKAIIQLLYDPDCDLWALSEIFIALRKEVKDPQNYLYQLVKQPYFMMLVHILQKYFLEMESFADYEEIALEVIEMLKEDGIKDQVVDELYEGRQFFDVYVLAHCALGEFYSRKGRLIQGEHYYRKVWEMARQNEQISAYTFCALSHFATNIAIQGDSVQGCEICAFLWNSKCTEIYQNDVQRFVHTYISLLESAGENEKAWKIMNEVLDKHMVYPTGKLERLSDIYGSYLGEVRIFHRSISIERLKQIADYYKTYESIEGFQTLVPWQRANFYLGAYYAENLLNAGASTKKLDKSVEILLKESFTEADRLPFLIGMMNVLMEYKECNLIEKLRKCTEMFMHKLLEYYSTAEFFTENEKMEQYTGICRLGFEYAYLAAADVETPEKLMEYSLNCKNILSSAIRLRNKIAPDKLLLRDKRECEFPYYSFEEFMDKLPENTAVIDFTYMNPMVYKERRIKLQETEERKEIYCYVVKKKADKIYFRERKIEDDSNIKADIRQFLEKMKNVNSKCRHLANRLYIELLQPFEDILEDAEHVWVSLDQDICNLPIQVLIACSQRSWTYQDIVYWQSLRDLFEPWQAGKRQIDTGCMIGNPAFSLIHKQGKSAHDQAERDGDDQMISLPFSAYEAEKLAQILKCRCCVGAKATKYVITSGYRYLHIATHGIVQEKDQNPWYNSALAFAGITDYMMTGEEREPYGNGSLTAEEISRMDLFGTELVVLSVCNSGSSYFSKFRQQTGLYAAFGVAGVRYIVSALWEVDDLAAAMFMFQFYENLLAGIAVPYAVEITKKQLQDMTVDEVRKILENDEQDTNVKIQEVKKNFAGLPDAYTLFSAPSYWGSFICYECMR